jgi:multifunctional beta-oxidation protein
VLEEDWGKVSLLVFSRKTSIITLRLAYALFFGSRGASVVVNDLGGSFKGEGNSTKVLLLQCSK